MSSLSTAWLVEVCPHPDGTAAVLVEISGDRYVLWPGSPPPLSQEPIPGLPGHAGSGQGLWAEHFPVDGCRLSQLTTPLPPQEGAALFADVARTLAALHAAGHAHGALHASFIALSGSAAPLLLGAGRRASSPEDDLHSFMRLWEQHCPDGPLVDARSAEAIVEGLQLWLSVSGPLPRPTLPARIFGARPSRLPDSAPVPLPGLQFSAQYDEIGVPIGPDEAGPGLLDAYTGGEHTGESTRELTGRIDDPMVQPPALQATVLFQLWQIVDQPSRKERFQKQEGIPSEGVQLLLEQAALDLLPAPEFPLAPNPRTIRHDWDDPSETASGAQPLPSAATTTAPLPPRRGFTGRIAAVLILLAAIAAGGIAVWRWMGRMP